MKNLDLSGKGGYYVSAVSRDTDENGIQGFFTVSLKSAPTDNVTVYVASSDTSEGVINRVGRQQFAGFIESLCPFIYDGFLELASDGGGDGSMG